MIEEMTLADGMERVTVYPRDGGEPWTYIRAALPEMTCDHCGARLARPEKMTEWACDPRMGCRKVHLCGTCADNLEAAALVRRA